MYFEVVSQLLPKNFLEYSWVFSVFWGVFSGGRYSGENNRKLVLGNFLQWVVGGVAAGIVCLCFRGDIFGMRRDQVLKYFGCII